MCWNSVPRKRSLFNGENGKNDSINPSISWISAGVRMGVEYCSCIFADEALFYGYNLGRFHIRCKVQLMQNYSKFFKNFFIHILICLITLITNITFPTFKTPSSMEKISKYWESLKKPRKSTYSIKLISLKFSHDIDDSN